MADISRSNVWLWKEPDNRWKEDVISHVKTQEPPDAGVVLLHCGDIADFEDSNPLIYYIFEICLQFKVFNQKIMFLKPKDFFQALELCMERLKSENNISGDVINEESVTSCHEMYINSLLSGKDNENKPVSRVKEFMAQNNCIDLEKMMTDIQSFKSSNHEFVEYISKRKFLILGTTEIKLFKEFINLLGVSDVVLSVFVETPLDISLHGSPSITDHSSDSSKIHVITEPINVEELCLTTENAIRLGSATEEYVEDIITSFLSLLINSRNELALSKIMISPFIDLSHEAFTHLKHLAVEKVMPMCQTALSYVTRVRLGGKGYAPPADCPMLPHLKSLELLVDTLNQMQNIVEEDSTYQSAVKRLINVLKKKLLKCGSSKLKSTAIEKAADNLNLMATKVLKLMKSRHSTGSTPQICQETLDVLYSFVNYVNCSCKTFDRKAVLMQKQSTRTPINLPPLLGYFRSPEEESCDEIPTVEEDSIMSNNSSLGFPPPLMSYFHHSDNSCSVSTTCVEVNNTPTKTNFKDCIKDVEVEESRQKKKEIPTNGRKRSILGDITNEKQLIPEKSATKKLKVMPSVEKQISKAKEKSMKMPAKKEIKKTKLSKKI